MFEVGVDPGEHCKDKCSCLARPRLRLSDHVLWRVRQQCRQGCFLDWGGLSHGLARQSEEYLDFGRSIEAHCIDTLEQIGLEVELFETFHRVERTVWVLPLDLQVILVLHQALPDHLQKNL